MKLALILTSLFVYSSAFADEKINMTFSNEELLKVIETYSKASGQKFVVDPAVRGKISILLPGPVTTEEAFNQLSSALAVNGYAISKQGDTMIVKTARNIQRDLIEVSTVPPTVTPERMYTWVYTLQNVPAVNVNRELRILTSRDGELSVSEATNQLVMTDWSSNLIRVGEILKQIDKKIDPSTSKLIEASKKKAELQKKDMTTKKEEKASE